MKRIFYILTAALVLGACTKELDTPSSRFGEEAPDAVYPEGATVDVYFSVPSGPITKGGVGDQPDITEDKMWVAVFDGSGSLKEYNEATFVAATANGESQTFKVTLLLKSSERRLHFLVNGPEKDKISSGMESQLMHQWTTTYPAAGYWQRIVLKGGVTAYSFSATQSNGSAWGSGDEITYTYTEETRTDESGNEYTTYVPASSGTTQSYTISVSNGAASYTDLNGRTVNAGDFVDARGCKIVDGTGYFQSAEVTEALGSVPLVRNFARIQIETDNEGNFTATDFYLMNIPEKASFAPWESTAGGFIKPYLAENGVATARENYDEFLKAIKKALYTGASPSGTSLIQTVQQVKDNGNAIPNEGDAAWTRYTVDKSAFLYERSVPSASLDPIYMLIGGELKDHGTRWFKVELADADGKYFPIYRDITYKLKINNIEGSTGYDSPAKAALGTPVSDVSNSTATETLTQIADGKGTALWVSYIDYVGNATAGETVKILYKAYLTATNAVISDTGRYTLSLSDNNAIEEILTQNVSSSDIGPDGNADWLEATVRLKPVSSTAQLNGNLTISVVTKDGVDKGNGKTLSRKVGYHVMPTQVLGLTATKLPSEKAEETTTLTIKLPKGLGFSLFPLVLKIEAEKANLNPVAGENEKDLPVETGSSYFTGKNTFYFLYTINWSDYKDASGDYKTDYTIKFATTKSYEGATNGSNETYISVTDRKGYFYYKPTDLSKLYKTDNKAVTKVEVEGGNSYFNVSPTSITVPANAESASFNISTNQSGTWSITRGSGVSNISPDSGSGNAAVTMSFSKNNNTNSLTRQATVTLPNGSTQDVTVTQAPAYLTLSESTASVAAATTSYNFTIDTNTDNAWTASVSGVDRAQLSKTSGTGPDQLQVTFPENTNTTARTITVTIKSTTYTGITDKKLEITQRRAPSQVTGTASFTYSDFNAGTNVSATKDDVKVTFSRISTVSTDYHDIEFNNLGTVTMTVEKDSNSTKQEFKLTGVSVNLWSGTDYHPTSVSSNPTGFTISGTTGSWSGSTDGNVVVSMTKTSGEFDIRSITITYSYMSDE